MAGAEADSFGHLEVDNIAMEVEVLDEINQNSETETCEIERMCSRIILMLLKCSDAASYEQHYQHLIKTCLFGENAMKTGTPHLFLGEKQMLLLSTYSKATDGILYGIPLIIEVNGSYNLYIRCFETGIFCGFFKHHWRTLFKDVIESHNIKDCQIICIYNQWDILACQKRRLTNKKGHASEKNSKVFKQLTTTNKSSINSTIPVAHAIFKNQFNTYAPGYVIYCQRMSCHTKGNKPESYQYFKMDGLGEESVWSREIKNYATNHPLVPNIELANLVKSYDSDQLTLQQQYDVLSSLPNYHHWTAKDNSGVKMMNYFVPSGSSPRNICLLEFEKCKDDAENLSVLKEIIKLVLTKEYHIPQVPKRKPKRISKQQVQRDRIGREVLLNQLDMTEDEFRQSNFNTTIYQNFKASLFNDGTLLWRENSFSRQVIIMNDYNSETGYFKFNDFVTVIRETKNDITDVTCNCEIFKVLSSTVDDVEWNGISCCHIRALNDIYSEFDIIREDSTDHNYVIPRATTSTSTTVSSKVNQALEAVSQPVYPLKSTTENVEKFSVKSVDGHQFVHVFKNLNGPEVYVKCCSGICSSTHAKKVNIRVLGSKDSSCPHLEIFKTYVDEHWQDHPLLSTSREPESDSHQLVSDGSENVDPSDDSVKVVDGFDVATGLWSFWSPFGRDVCGNVSDAKYMKNCKKHIKYSNDALQDELFEVFMFPEINSLLCSCKQPWPKDTDGDYCVVFDINTTIFTKIAAVACQTYKTVCSNSLCVIRWDGAAENVFRVSNQVSVVEEICWDFIDLVGTMKCNFSAYCQYVNNAYVRNGSTKPFITPKTFSKLFFSWASHQNKDFRKVCNWCGNNPSILACDATKIGILHHNTNIKPIEKVPVGTRMIPTKYRRFDRCFIAYTTDVLKPTVRDARKYLKIISSNNPTLNNQLSELQHEEERAKLRTVFPACCVQLLNSFIAQNVTSLQLQATKRVFYLLSFDAPIRSFLPMTLLPSIQQLVSTTSLDESIIHNVYTECTKCNQSLGNFIKAFFENDIFHPDAKSLLHHLCDRLNQLDNQPCPPPQEVNNSYNPPTTGQFYYFNSKGNQVRSNRQYSIDKPSAIHDDIPTTSSCSKKYPTVAKRGSSFLFLWFCPKHGHCYGGHIVDGSEGRKDPACSLYRYLEKAPDVVFYDFACGLEEYVLNRESEYFAKTRFYHDIFHGFSHNCSPLYSSRGLPGLKSLNTSICEQFNAYLQCIKSSAKHMSQEHFIFYVQFMIDIWNRKKEDSFTNKLKIALSGSE